MPTGADPAHEPDLLVDMSVAVALVVGDHEHHTTVAANIGTRRLGLAGHAAFETFSVLTRLPPPARRAPTVVAELLRVGFPATRFLDAPAMADLFVRLAELGIAGGAVYDALVGAVAVNNRLTLATRDRRAVEVYRSLGVDFILVE